MPSDRHSRRPGHPTPEASEERTPACPSRPTRGSRPLPGGFLALSTCLKSPTTLQNEVFRGPKVNTQPGHYGPSLAPSVHNLGTTDPRWRPPYTIWALRTLAGALRTQSGHYGPSLAPSVHNLGTTDPRWRPPYTIWALRTLAGALRTQSGHYGPSLAPSVHNLGTTDPRWRPPYTIWALRTLAGALRTQPRPPTLWLSDL